MQNLAERLVGLSPVKQSLMLRLLKDKGVEFNSFPLSCAQQRLYYLAQFEPDSPLYNMPVAVLIKGTLDVATLRRCFTEVARRHEVLRTVFAAIDGEPVQIIESAEEVPLPVIDLENAVGPDRERVVAGLVTEEALRPFRLEQGTMFRVKLLRTDEREHVLLMTMHHIASDGWSMGIFIQEIVTSYEAFCSGKPVSLAELEIQYADFAAWQHEALQDGRLAEHLEYWMRKLAAAPGLLRLPTDRPRPAVQTFRGSSQRMTLTRNLTCALNALSRREGVTLFMVLLAGFNIVLNYFTNETDLVVGTDVAGRTRSETEPLIGFFVNQLPLRIELSGDPTFRELLRRVGEVTLDGYAHQDMPFDKIVSTLNPERSPAHSPIFQVKLVLQNAPAAKVAVSGLVFELLPQERRVSKLDLICDLFEDQGQLTGVFEYNADLFDPGTINRMITHFKMTLQHSVTQPEAKLSEFKAILSEADRREALMKEQTLEQVRMNRFARTMRRSVTGLEETTYR